MTQNDFYAMLPDVLLPWFAEHRRDLPWRADREPYHVWLSEIMLQQTRVEAVKAYYTRFTAQLPDLAALAAAPDDTLTKLWEGLGYYTRMRNLRRCAQQILRDYGGQFPDTAEALQHLPGIGAYTAGAIASICFNRPTPAVDGNVLRVLSRIGEIGDMLLTSAGKRAVTHSLAAVYPLDACGDFTQALMELGALICLPNGAPLCTDCPCSTFCGACLHGTQMCYPVKKEKKPRKSETMSVAILSHAGKLCVRKRPETGLLAGLYEFPHFPGTLEAEEMLQKLTEAGFLPAELQRRSDRVFLFTHVEWHMSGFYIVCAEAHPSYLWVEPDSVALPTAFRLFLDAPEAL